MTRDRRPGAGTNAPTGVTPAAASTTTTATARAGAFFVGPSFHALRVRGVLSLVLVRVCPILRCVALGQERSGWVVRGRKGTYEDNFHLCVCGLCAGLRFGCVGEGRHAHAHVRCLCFVCLRQLLIHPGHVLRIERVIFL